MSKIHCRVVASCIGLLLCSGGFCAQAPPKPPQAPPPRPRIHTFELLRTVFAMREIDKNKKYALTPGQAKKVLALLSPLRTKPKLTQAEAGKTLEKLNKLLTKAQIKAMADLRPRRFPGRPEGRRARDRAGPPGPAGPPPGNRDGTGPPPGEGMRRQVPADFNPFYTKATGQGRFFEERKKLMDEFFAGLGKKAKQADAKPAAPKKKVATKAGAKGK